MPRRFKVMTTHGVMETDGQVFLALVQNNGHLWVSSFIYTDEEQLNQQMNQDQFTHAARVLKVNVDLNKVQLIKGDGLHTDKA